MKSGTSFFGILSVVATIVGLIQAFSFEHLDSVKCNFYRAPQRGNIVDCLYDLRSNAGKVVMLDWSSYVGEPMPNQDELYPFGRREDENSVSWFFDVHTIAVEACEVRPTQYPLGPHECGWVGSRQAYAEIKAQIAARYSERGLRFDDIGVPENGIRVIISGYAQSSNPYSSFEPFIEGMEDAAHGPYQITAVNRDAALIYRLSPAPMTDELPSQVRCAKRDWPEAVKFLLCPFT